MTHPSQTNCHHKMKRPRSFVATGSAVGTWGRLFLLVTTSLWVMGRTAAQGVGGIQSHWLDASFAGGMAYDSTQELIYLTGQVGINQCFVGIVQRRDLQFISKLKLPQSAICQGIALGDTASTALLLATTEEGGLFTNLRPRGSNKATQYGLVLTVNWNTAATQARLPQGLLLHEDPVQYPRAILNDPVHTNYLYVVSVHSEDASLSDSFRLASEETPNLTPSGMLKYGSRYFMQVERLKHHALAAVETAGGGFSETETSLEPDWRKPFGLTIHPTAEDDPNKDDGSVYIANTIWNNGALVIAGSTRGSGPVFGDADLDVNGNSRMNGFLTKIEPLTGQVWYSGNEDSPSVLRYNGGRGPTASTLLSAVCSGSHDSQDLFITGLHHRVTSDEDGVAGTRQTVAFLARIDATTLETVWEELFPFTQDSEGLACAVDPEGGVVYAAGIVADGGTFGEATAALGLDDIFVVQSQISDGHPNWIRQVGTQGHDRVAQGGSGLLVVPDTDGSGDGNGVLLFGDTTGDLRSINRQGTEVFLLMLNAAGNLPETSEVAGGENNGGGLSILTPALATDDFASDSSPSPDDRPSGGGTTPNDDNEASSEPASTPLSKRGGTGGGLGMLAMVVFLGGVLVCGYLIKSHQKEKVTERALVFSYLHSFDLEDIDVRHSATGGWHGTYVGDLAKGFENVHNASAEKKGSRKHLEALRQASRLSHSSVVKDALFVDYEASTPVDPSFDDDHAKDPYLYQDENNNNNNETGEDTEAAEGSFRIGGDSDEEDDDDMDDFEGVSRLEEELNEVSPDHNPWGREII